MRDDLANHGPETLYLDRPRGLLREAPFSLQTSRVRGWRRRDEFANGWPITFRALSSRCRCNQRLAALIADLAAPHDAKRVQDEAVTKAQLLGVQYSFIRVGNRVVTRDTPIFVTNHARAVFARRVRTICIAVIPSRHIRCRHCVHPFCARLLSGCPRAPRLVMSARYRDGRRSTSHVGGTSSTSFRVGGNQRWCGVYSEELRSACAAISTCPRLSPPSPAGTSL
jgi:hypothetical protein